MRPSFISLTETIITHLYNDIIFVLVRIRWVCTGVCISTCIVCVYIHVYFHV